MDGKIFLNSNGTPPRIAFSPAFTFDLQRFDTIEVSSASELSTTISNATAGDTIKLGNSFAGTLTETLTIDKNLTLDLNGRTLTSSANKGFTVSAGKTFTVDDTSSGKNGSIVHTAYTDGSSAKDNRSTNNAINLSGAGASFIMKGGNITSESVSVFVATDNTTANIQVDDGNITSNKSCVVYFKNNGTNDYSGTTLNVNGGTLTSKGYLPTIQVAGNVNDSTKGYTINLNNGANIVYNESDNVKNDKTAKSADLSKGAIFISGASTLNVNDGANITSSHVGIEFRAGKLYVNNGSKIESTTEIKDNTAISYHKTARGVAFNDGVAIAVAKAEGKNIEVNINGGTIEGYAALAVSNPNGVNQTATISVKGGTLTSTSTATADEATYFPAESSGVTDNDTNKNEGKGDPVPLYTLKGKNAIVNFDTDVTVDLSGTTVKGSVAAMMTGRASDSTGYTLGEGNTFSNFTYPKTGGELVSYYNVADADNANKFTVAMLGSNQSWNTKTSAAENTWEYLVKGATGTKAIVATLAPKEGANNILEITSEVTGSNSYTVPLDLTDTNVFSGIDNYTVLDASGITNTNLKFNITGNDKITSIVGGAGADSLKAVNTEGVTLNGGAGNDLLIGGNGADTFIFGDNGSDTIQDYVYGKDAVSLGADFKLPTSFASINNSDSSNFVLAFSETASLTFRPIAELQIAKGDDTFSYTAKSIALDNASSHGISLGAGWTSDFNGTKEAYENYATIDAAGVTKTIKITGNDKANSIVGGTGGGTLLGGDNDDTLVAGGGSTTLNGGDDDDLLIGSNTSGSYNLFVYSAGKDSIENYNTGDLINVTGRNISFNDVTASKVASTDDLLIKFDDNNSMSIKGGATASTAVSVASGRRTYVFKDGSIALEKSITLTSDFAGTSFDKGDAYDTINAAAVTTEYGISIKGNDNANYLVGSTDKKNTLDGGADNDTLVGGTLSAEDTFIYSAGKDVIENFNADNDKLSIDSTKIESGKATSNKLTFTINKKSDVLTFNFGDGDAIEKVSLQDGGYLTKDGYVKDNALTLFSSAKGNITVGGGTGLYSGVSTVDAEEVKKQGVTLVGGESDGLYKFNGSNKQKDGFTYVGGTVSISGYEGGRDRIDLGTASISSFKIENTNDVVLNIGNDTGSISIAGAKDAEVLLRENNKNSKLVFKAAGVLENKAKNPTMATVSAGYTASGKINKIFVADGTTGIKIQAGNNNTVIDASKAGGVSLSGGTKNDKLIGSSNADMYIYGAGKDVIQGFGSDDQISLSGTGSLAASLTSAKITQSSSNIKFKFDNKNTLTIKADKENTTFKNGKLQINGTNYTYQKNAVQNDGTVSLTSSFGGTFNTSDTTQKEIDGHRVKNNLTFVGSTRDEKFIGSNENKKTTFKGGGGNDTLVGGASKDTFFYAKSYTGDAVIQSFDFKNDKLKVASGKIGRISSISGGSGGIEIGMTNGQKNSSAIVGSFKITSDKAGYNASGTSTFNATNVAFKANNTYYWFAEDDDKYVSADDGTAIKAGQLITTENRLSALPTDLSTDLSGASVIDLNYSTNLAKSGVAVKVTSATPKTTT